MLVSCLLSPAVFNPHLLAEETKVEKIKNGVIGLVIAALNGFTFGTDTRVFPYASLEDWFEPYVGVKLGHRSFVHSRDRMSQHIKFEGFRDYSWKFRYPAR